MPDQTDPFAAIDSSGSSPMIGAAVQAQGQPEDPFAYIDAGGTTGDRLAAVTRLGLIQDPARAARVLRLRDGIQMPSDFIDRNLDELEKTVRQQDFNPDKFRANSPLVAKWLEDSPEYVGLSRDDLPRLAAVEKFVSDSPNYRYGPKGEIIQASTTGYANQFRSPLELLRKMQSDENIRGIEAADASLSAERYKRGAFMTGVVQSAGQTLRLIQSATGQDTEETKRQLDQIARNSETNDPGFWNDMLRGAGGLAADAPLMVAGGVLAPLGRLKALMGTGKLANIAAGAAATAIASQPLAVREGVTTGLDNGWANGLASWGIETVVPAAFGTTGAEKIIEHLAARGIERETAGTLFSASVGLLTEAGLEGTEESVTELAHALHESASGMNPDALKADQLWRRLALAGALGGVAGAGFNLPHAISQLAARGNAPDQIHQVEAALAGQGLIEQLTTTAGESLTAQRYEPAAKSLFQALTKDKQEQVWIDRDRFDEIAKASGLDPRSAAVELLGGPAPKPGEFVNAKTAAEQDAALAAYEDSARTGAPLTVKTADLAFFLARQKQMAEAIGKEVRLDPRALNVREAEAELAKLESVATDPNQRAQNTPEEQAVVIREQITNDLVAQGMSQDAAQRSATQTASVFRTMAARFNAGKAADDATRISPEQLWNEWNVSINRAVDPILQQTEGLTPDQVLAKARSTLNQATNQQVTTSYEQRANKVRGSITFEVNDKGERKTVINLFESNNLSTFLHESGHLYLEVLADLAGRPGAPQDIKDDLSKALAYLGAKDVSSITVDQHETWARSWEAYLMEGKAPTAELRGVFARFAAWLSDIYRKVSLRVTLTPEIRGVMDRLIATKDEIDAAQNSIGDDGFTKHAMEMGLTQEQADAIAKADAEATDAAQVELQAEAMQEIRREKEAHYQELRAVVEKEVTAETNAVPVYRAEAILRRGVNPDGSPLADGVEPIKLDTADVNRRLDSMGVSKEETRANRNRLTMMHVKEGGMSLDDSAPLLGFDSGDQLLRSLLTMRNKKDLIAAETDHRMRERHGDILTDGTIAEKAMDTLHSERRAEVHQAKIRALGTKVGKKTAPIEVMRQSAKAKISKSEAGYLYPNLYLQAEIKARRHTEAHLAKQEWDAALAAKQRELLNHELYRAATEAKQAVEETRLLGQRMQETKTRETIGKAGGWEWTVYRADGSFDAFDTEDEARQNARQTIGATFERTSGYLEQIDALLERYSFKRGTKKEAERRQSLSDWVAKMQAQGQPVDIPDALMKSLDQVDWRKATVEELAALRDAVEHIAGMARLKNKLSKLQRNRELDATATELTDTLKRTHPKEKPPGAGEKAGVVPGFIAAHRKAANIARQMDGDEDNGAFWNALIRPMNESANEEAIKLHDAKTEQERIWTEWANETKGDGWRPNERREFSGFHKGLSRMGAIMVALNWGNVDNRMRLMDGGQGRGKISEEQVVKVLDSLNAADWKLVNAVWKHIDSYWSEIKALDQRTRGISAEKVEAAPFPTKYGTQTGGYFPIVYSGQETTRIDGDSSDLGKQIQAQAYGSTTTSRGHTKERAATGKGNRLDLDPGVIGTHLTKVIHDLTHREALADAMRILLHKKVRTAIDSRMGVATTKYLRQWIADIATGGTPPDAVARGLGWMRRGFSIATMGFRTMTAAVQITGIANSAGRIGTAYVARGVAHLFSETNGKQSWQFISDSSAMMRHRETTQSREQNEILGQFQRGRLENLQAAVGKYAFWMMGKVQGVVDRATWLGAYEKASDEGKGHDDAVAIADQTVIDTQGGGQTKDLSGVQRSQYAQVFTGAYTYGSMLFNQVYDQGAKIRRNPKDFATWAGAFGAMSLSVALPAALSVFLRALLRNDWPDNEKDSFAQRAGIELGTSLMGTMLISRELSGMFGGFDYSGPAVTKPFGDLLKLKKQVRQGEIDQGLIRSVIEAGGSTLGLPSGQIWASGSGLMEWLQDPSLDLRAPVFGPEPVRR